MAAYYCHQPIHIELPGCRSLLIALHGIIRFLTGIDCFNRYLKRMYLGFCFACLIYSCPNQVDLDFINKVFCIIKMRGISGRGQMPMVEVTINRNVDVPTTIS